AERGTARERRLVILPRLFGPDLRTATFGAPRNDVLQRVQLELLSSSEAIKYQVGFGPFVLSLAEQPTVEFAEDVLHQARPEVGFDVVPGVEFDLNDIRMEELRPGLRALRQRLHVLVDAAHEERLARAPLAKNADGQRRANGGGRQNAGKSRRFVF